MQQRSQKLTLSNVAEALNERWKITISQYLVFTSTCLVQTETPDLQKHS